MKALCPFCNTLALQTNTIYLYSNDLFYFYLSAFDMRVQTVPFKIGWIKYYFVRLYFTRICTTIIIKWPNKCHVINTCFTTDPLGVKMVNKMAGNWWILCTLHLLVCHVRVTVGDSDLFGLLLCYFFWVLVNSLISCI